jgi:hypothetical protein
VKKKSKAEVHYTRGGLKTPVEGFANGDFPKSSPFFKEYGPHKEPGGEPPACTRPDGSGESQIAAKFKRGK